MRGDSDRARSPEFSEDGERYAQARGARLAAYRCPLSAAEARRLDAIQDQAGDAAWRAFPEVVSNPFPAGTPEAQAWQLGADSNYRWARVHVEEGWYRIVDGVRVAP
ncbi:MAG: hypothetical protein AB7U92_25090 [Piscinibacter sp.]|uniref:hypothetical protein n=1 Tax=Piscinibacter sp. TaxID=1903157 RepID=UPI003D12AD44